MGWIIFILGTIGWHIGMYGMFKKAGIDAWKALIPFYNTWCMVEITGIKKWWFWLQFVPIAGQFVSIWITIIFTMHFGKFDLLSHTAVVLVPFLYFPYLGFVDKQVRWGGREVMKLYKKSATREWIDAAVFAVVAATIIRTFIFEAYTIPTESMEKTLLVNDFLFVNKMVYGPRLPQTPLSFPFVHNTLPFSQTKVSYLRWASIPYTRIKGYDTIHRNDVVVFNFPAGDTIINLPGFQSKAPYYDVLRDEYKGNREALLADYPIVVHPVDKTDNYIKRCTAIPGDVLELKNSVLYINGAPAFIPPYGQIDYIVRTKSPFTNSFLSENLGIDDLSDNNGQLMLLKDNWYRINMTAKEYEVVKSQPNVDSIAVFQEYHPCFPHDPINQPWTTDNFGPLTIPRKGATITLTPQNIAIYRRLITTYESNTLEEKNNTFIINGVSTNQYTFKYNYYWMMGDNRHRSQDSRYWGFVPETHIVGRASMIWMSYGKGPRWNRIFSFIK
ncbi:MAG TPA: S26 family signal peptidase [Chitinophagaceae bacterium]|nr:S26 family signal peptidase [Chitinophagaceae bacterium]HAN37828.1 S26 family signal peptidase [Chitinophagaceae bacterium]